MYKTVLLGAALIAGSVGFAVAQNAGSNNAAPGAASTSGQCWDQASNQVRNRSAQNTTGAGSSTSGSNATTGSANSGNGVSSGGAAGNTAGAGSSTAQRPAGMQNC